MSCPATVPLNAVTRADIKREYPSIHGLRVGLPDYDLPGQPCRQSQHEGVDTSLSNPYQLRAHAYATKGSTKRNPVFYWPFPAFPCPNALKAPNHWHMCKCTGIARFFQSQLRSAHQRLQHASQNHLLPTFDGVDVFRNLQGPLPKQPLPVVGVKIPLFAHQSPRPIYRRVSCVVPWPIPLNGHLASGNHHRPKYPRS